MDLIGIPYRITVGRGVKDGKAELKLRSTGEVQEIALSDLPETIIRLVRENTK